MASDLIYFVGCFFVLALCSLYTCKDRLSNSQRCIPPRDCPLLSFESFLSEVIDVADENVFDIVEREEFEKVV